jgi:hypothetical protein
MPKKVGRPKKAKKQHGGCKCKHDKMMQQGDGFFGDVGNFFTKTIPRAARSAHDWVKKNKVISRIGNAIPHPYGKAVGAIVLHASGERSAASGMSGHTARACSVCS